MPHRVPFNDLSPETLDFQLSPSKSAKDFMTVLERHSAATAALVTGPALQVTRDVAYGADPMQAMDITRPVGKQNMPALVFIHGGFWQEGSKDWSGFAAQEMAAQGWAHIGLGYRLAPAARLRDIVRDIATGLAFLRLHATQYGIDPTRIVVAGHSAGAQLTAAIMAGQAGQAAADSLAGAVLISGVYDLAPIAASYVNDAAAIDAAEIADLSPLYQVPVRDIPVSVLIGADEPDAFQRQTDALVTKWGPLLSDITCRRVAGRDHFDILDELTPASLPSL